MKKLFEPAKIGNIEVKNRFIRSATGDSCANTDGFVTDKQISLYKELASGGVGLIITGICYVHPLGKISKWQNAIWNDRYVSGLKKLTQAVHEKGSKIALQLFHGGRESAKILNKDKKKALAPTFVRDDPFFKGEYRSLKEKEIYRIIESFAQGARRAREAGFDAVQIHGAHAYLFSQFLSPFTNRRRDIWGGSINNRLRLHFKVYEEIRKIVFQDFPILIKLGVQDFIPEGLEFKEGKLAGEMLSEIGFDALEISSGLRGKKYAYTEFQTRILKEEREAYFRNWCKEISRSVKIPTIMVGGLRTLQLMKEIIEDEEASFISLARPLINDPDLINKWKKNRRYKSRCISCNKCLESMIKGVALHCKRKKIADKKRIN